MVSTCSLARDVALLSSGRYICVWVTELSSERGVCIQLEVNIHTHIYM